MYRSSLWIAPYLVCDGYSVQYINARSRLRFGPRSYRGVQVGTSRHLEARGVEFGFEQDCWQTLLQARKSLL